MATITLSLKDPQPACPDSGGEVPAIADSLVLSLDPAKYSSTPTNPVVAQVSSITPNPNVYDCWSALTGPGQDYELVVADVDLPFVGGIRVTDINECDLLAKPVCSSCCTDHEARLDAIESVIGVTLTPTVASLTTLTTPVDGALHQTHGWYAPLDGGGNLYRYDAGSSAQCDGGFVVDGIGGSNTPAATQASYAGTGVGRFFAVDQTVANAKQFGAKGDGVTDDTFRLQAAIFAAEVVSFQAGVYAVGSQVALPSKRLIDGGGATLKELNKIKHTFFLNGAACDGSEIKDLICEGTEDQAGYVVPASPDDANAFIRIQSSRCRVSNIRTTGKPMVVSLSLGDECSVENVFMDGIFTSDPGVSSADHTAVHIKDSDRVVVRNVSAKNCGSCVLTGSTPDSLLVEGCRADTCYDNCFYLSSADNAMVRDCYGINSSGSGVKCRGDRNRVEGCIISSTGVGITMTGKSGTNSTGVAVIGNQIDGAGIGIFIDDDGDGVCNQVKVQGNTILDFTGTGIWADRSSDILISDNIIKSPTPDGNGGILVLGKSDHLSRNVVISDNSIEADLLDDRRAVRLDYAVEAIVKGNRFNRGQFNSNFTVHAAFSGAIEQEISMSGATTGTNISAPDGCVIEGADFLVIEDVTTDGDGTWDGYFVVGSSTALVNGVSGVANTAATAELLPEKATGNAPVQCAPATGTTFTGGKILVSIRFRHTFVN